MKEEKKVGCVMRYLVVVVLLSLFALLRTWQLQD
jgi:hypothetical protein